MTKTIAINAGSSSLKWQLYEMPEEVVLAKGLIERIGLGDSVSTLDIADHVQAVKILLDDLIRFDIIKSYDEITGVGHRVVAGGEYFKESSLVDEYALAKIEELSALAPLHNPGAASGIRAFKELLPDITSVAVFDTAFHTSMPEVAYRYPVPNRYYTDYQVRKYGAHGTSHQYVSQEAAKLLGKPIEETKIITAHVGNGVSITAVDGGKSVDTSMGLTPLGGVMMGTRTGDLDPAIIPFIIDREPDMADAERIRHVFNKESGLLGISEKSSDMRDIIAGKEAGDEKCTLAYDLYVDRLRKYIAQYFGVMNGADAIVFTAGIGENSADVRASVLDGLTWFGIEVDPEKNVFGRVGDITTADSAVKVFVIPTDEELVIARDVERLKTK